MSARSHHNPRHVEWAVIAVDEDTPTKHAYRLQQALTSLTEAGFNIVSTMPRGTALIITASRFSTPQQTDEASPPASGGGKLSN